jgi:hypothetical protein
MRDTVRFFEADGVTPAAVTFTAEPSSMALLAGGLIFAGILRRRVASSV